MSINSLNISDKVLGVLFSLKSDENIINMSPLELQKFFYNLSKKEKFHEIFPKIIFDTRDNFPLSEELEYAINGLILAGHLEQYGLKGTGYHLTKLAVNYYEIIKNDLDNEIKQILN